MDHFITQLLRPGRSGAHEVRADLLWLGGLILVLIATGIGLRDPWPADEPRFALIARDMVANQQWLIPQVGGDNYADKPPLFFWLIGIGLLLTNCLRVAFLLPSLLAGAGCVILVYDLARRLWNRETGMVAALALLATVQFVWQARQAQIDATLCFFTTLSLYGLLRHCLLGPSWKWYAIGWAAAGFGIITKGVGFLPLLILIPYALMRRGTWNPRPAIKGGWRWMLGPVALLAAVSLWLVPMLLAATHDPALLQYRNEILFGQTVNRYAGAWHHREPFWYFLVEVVPALWLPVTALLPWLVPRWRESFRQRDLRVWLPLLWIVLVVLFFSLSSGKRGVYVLPAVPALAIACAPWLVAVSQHRGAQRTMFGIACAIAVVTLAGAIFMLTNAHERHKLIDSYDIDAVIPLFAIGIAAAASCAAARPARGFAAYALSLAAALLIVSFWVNPVMNDTRSGADIARKVQSMSTGVRELGLVAYKEQYLLYLTRPVTNFGHARWREAEQEAADAAAWLAVSRDRALMVDQHALEKCFAAADAREIGIANRQRWFLVGGKADPECVAKGNPAAALLYEPAIAR